MIYDISPVMTSSFPTTLIFSKKERSLYRNPNNSQLLETPLYKEILRNLTKLRKKNESSAKEKPQFFILHCRVHGKFGEAKVVLIPNGKPLSA